VPGMPVIPVIMPPAPTPTPEVPARVSLRDVTRQVQGHGPGRTCFALRTGVPPPSTTHRLRAELAHPGRRAPAAITAVAVDWERAIAIAAEPSRGAGGGGGGGTFVASDSEVWERARGKAIAPSRRGGCSRRPARAEMPAGAA